MEGLTDGSQERLASGVKRSGRDATYDRSPSGHAWLQQRWVLRAVAMPWVALLSGGGLRRAAVPRRITLRAHSRIAGGKLRRTRRR